jgi:exo-beta-1,3-glucanase (GH17 family)
MLPSFFVPRWLNRSQQLEAIKQTKVDMIVFLGNYAIPDDNGTAYIRQRNIIQDTLKTYGPDHVAGVTVGNEYMLKYDCLRSTCENFLLASVV